MDQISQLLAQPQAQVSIPVLLLDIILAAVCAALLAKFYNRYGYSLSNRSRLARNFIPIAVTTALIITIVKSSLALSLGLVGALSIVRFRSAIKEPEELAYLFLAISIGLGFGANQHIVTLVAFGLILTILYIQRRNNESSTTNLYLSVAIPGKRKVELGSLLNVLTKSCKKLDIKRVDYKDGGLEAGFYIEFDDVGQMEESLTSLTKKFPKAEVNFIDQSGMLV